MKKINLKKYISSKSAIFILVLFVSIFLFGNYAAAGWEHGIIAGIIGVFISGITKILILLVNVLISVASYSDFIHAAAVTKGWVVVRDVCNMFFVVILLVIAFATILGKEEFSAKKNLPKLIMAAVLINFSKLFCGLMIDVANVVMLTFVNAFKEIGSGNIIDMLGISDVLRYGSGGDAPSFSSTVSAYIFGLIYVLIATVVVASMLAMLVMRVVMMWIYIVLSPAAFFLQAVPGKGQQYASQWWTKWTSNLIVGPVLAFFLWLSFAALQTGTDPIPVVSNTQNESETAAYATTDGGSESIDSKAGSVSGFAKFAIAIGMLLGGMKIAQEVGGETGSALGKGMGYINKGKALAIGGAGAVGGYALGRAKALGKAGAGAAGRGARNLGLTATGNLANLRSDIDPLTGKRKGNAIGNLALQWRDDLKSDRKKAKDASREKFLKSIGMGDKSAEIVKTSLNTEGIQSFGRGAKNLSSGAATGMVIGGSLGAFAGPLAAAITAAIGGTIGGTVGLVNGLSSKKDQATAKSLVTSYETNAGATGKNEDDKEINTITDQNNKASWTPAQEAAVERRKAYLKNKGIVTNYDNKQAFSNTIGAAKNMTKDKEDAKKWIKATSTDQNLLSGSGKGDFYSKGGFSKTNKNRFEALNKGGDDATKLIDNLVSDINTMTGGQSDAQLESFAKAMEAYKKGGGDIDPAHLGRVEQALIGRGKAPSDYTEKVFTNYKDFDPNIMAHTPGAGALKYDTFAKNAVKKADGKDIMEASFDKINKKAGKDILDPKAGIHIQELSGDKLKEVSTAMSSLIDDEIAALQTAGAGITDEALRQANDAKITDLNTAKDRFKAGDLSKLSVLNSDIEYAGANDSEKRRNKENSIQHEIMHSAGATNEAAVYGGADALQAAKLVGNIPGSKQRYDVALGKMIADMQKAEASQEEMSEAIASQVEKWKVPNAQRVVETEQGIRDHAAVPVAEMKTTGMEKAINKLTSSFEKSMGVSGQSKGIQLSPAERDFFRKLSAKQNKISSTVVEKLKPLGAMAAAEEKKRNP